MTSPVHHLGDLTPDPYEAALEKALAEIAVVRASTAALKEQLASADIKCAELGAAVQGLTSLLPPGRAEQYHKRLRDLDAVPSVASTKGGPVYGNVVNFLARQKHRDGNAEVTSTEVKEELVEKGPRHDAKEIDNVLSYLARSGQLRRISRGRYVIRDLNVGLNLSFDFDEGQHVPEDHDQ